MKKQKRTARTRRLEAFVLRGLAGSAGIALAAGVGGSAWAFAIDTGNEDVAIQWDQTVRYNFGRRMAGRDTMGSASSFVRDESEYLFDKGDTMMNRVDWYSEFDLNYKRQMGFRVSASLWYDNAYDGKRPKSDPSPTAGPPGAPGQPVPSYMGGPFPNYVKRYYAGPSGEFSDAFVWANFDMPAGTANVKVGRFGVQWGEAVFPTAAQNSVGYGMSPMNVTQAVSSPGATAKETLLPLGQIVLNMPVTPELDLSAQYSMEWRANRLPEAGTYFGVSDALTYGPRTYAGLTRTGEQEGQGGDIGVMLKYSPDWMDGGSLGLVYRKYDEKTLGWLSFNLNNGSYHITAPRDIKLLGLTFNRTIAGFSVGAELSRRHDQPLLGFAAAIPFAYTITGADYQKIPVGTTTHGLINLGKTFNKNSAFDSAIFLAELSVVHLDRVSKNASSLESALGGRVVAPVGYLGNSPMGPVNPTTNCASSRDMVAGCPTRTATKLDLLFLPTWNQVFPGIDLSMPLIYQRGLSGNSPTNTSYKGGAIYSVGVTAKIYNTYNIGLSYTGFDNRHRGFGNGSQGANQYVAAGASYYDRDFLNLSFSTSF